MPTYNIYPDYDAFYTKSDRPFITARNASSSDSFSDGGGTLISSLIDEGGGTFQFIRTYLLFDLSSITEPISDIYLGLYVESVTGRGDIVIAYGGTSLQQKEDDYPSYITSGEREWSSRQPLTTEQYNEFYLDPNLKQYPNPSINPFLVIGVVTENDFDSVDVGGLTTVFTSSEGRDTPYLRIETSSASYTNTVMGVLSSSISTINGTNISNISKINVI
jgi:hypothetical protein